MTGRLLCFFGRHTPDRTQGKVGYCLRPGCTNLKRRYLSGTYMTLYVEQVDMQQLLELMSGPARERESE